MKTEHMDRYRTLEGRIRQEVPALISLEREGSYWDFKREWHDSNSALIHDILCLANNLESEVSYLIIGVDEENGYSACDVKENGHAKRRSNQNVVDMLAKTPWGSAQPPFVVVVPLELRGDTIDVLAIVSRREDMPYYLAKSSGDVRPGLVYTRRVDQNSPIDRGASWSEVQAIWRHHFALDESPVVRARYMLADKGHWELLSSVNSTDDKYYSFAPEYTIRHHPDDERDAYEYYMLDQTDPRPHWYDIELCYHQTTIYDTVGISLDGGRYFAPVPEWSFFSWPDNPYQMDPDLTYCYYLRDSMDWALNMFFYDADYDDATISRNRLLKAVVLFDDDEERLSFERFLGMHKAGFCKAMYEAKKPYGAEKLPDEYAQEAKDSMGQSLKAVPILQQMLQNFRSSLAK